MSAKPVVCLAMLVACAGPPPPESRQSTREPAPREAPLVVAPTQPVGDVEPLMPAQVQLMVVPVSPHPAFPSDWRIRAVEPLEVQVSPAHFLSAPAGQVLITGERTSRWPIYGSIVMRRNKT